MKQKQFKARSPDYKGAIQVSAWCKTDETGKPVLSISIGKTIKLTPYTPPIKVEEVAEKPAEIFVEKNAA